MIEVKRPARASRLSAGLGLLLGHTRKMFTCVTNEGLKMLSNFAVKVRELKLLALNFLLIELRNKAAHVFEVCRRLVNHMLYEIVALWVKIFGARQGKRRPDVGLRGVIPESYIRQINLAAQMGIVGALAWRKEFESDFREAAQSDGKKLCGLSGIIPWGSDETGKPVGNLGVYGLQCLNLGLDTNQCGLDAALGVLALRVEIHGLPDCNASQDNRHDARNKTDSFYEPPERPNAVCTPNGE